MNRFFGLDMKMMENMAKSFKQLTFENFLKLQNKNAITEV